MASGAECLLNVRKNIYTIFLLNKREQLPTIARSQKQLKLMENDHFQYPKFSLSDLSYILFGKNCLIMVNLFLGFAMVGFMLLFFEFLEYTIISMMFKDGEDSGKDKGKEF